MATGGEGSTNDQSIATMDYLLPGSDILDGSMYHTTSQRPATWLPHDVPSTQTMVGKNHEGPSADLTNVFQGNDYIDSSIASPLGGLPASSNATEFSNTLLEQSIYPPTYLSTDKSLDSDAIKLAVDSKFNQSFLSMFAPQEVASTTSPQYSSYLTQHNLSPPSLFIPPYQSMLSVDPFALPNNTSLNQAILDGDDTDERTFGQKASIIQEGLSPRSVALDEDFTETNAAVSQQPATAPTGSLANREIQKVQVTRAMSDTASNDDKASVTQVVTRHCCPFPECDKTFSTNGHARRHSRIHDNIKPFRCNHPSCFAQFSRKDNLQQHAKRHSS